MSTILGLTPKGSSLDSRLSLKAKIENIKKSNIIDFMVICFLNNKCNTPICNFKMHKPKKSLLQFDDLARLELSY